MEKIISTLFTGLDEFAKGQEKDLEQLKALAREVIQTYQQVPFFERYHTIQSLLLSIAGLSGEAFFQYLVEEIRQILEANYVVIAQINPNLPEFAQTVVVNYKGQLQPNFEYALEFCPCRQVISEKKDFFQQNVSESYPEWAERIPADAVHYYGIPLFGTGSEVIGLLIAMFDHIPHHLDWAHLVLELVSGRVALELMHRRNEQMLKESERKMHVLIETITDYLIINKVKNGTIYDSWHSPTCINVTGYASDEYKQNPSLWFDMIHEHDKVYVMGKINAILETKESKPFEHRIIHKNGTIRWIRNTPIIFKNIKGEIDEVHNIIQDITEVKQIELKLLEHENQYRLLFNQMGNGFILCQPLYKSKYRMDDFVILDVNPAFEKIVGRSKEHIVNKKASEFSNAIPQEWMEKFSQVIRTHQPISFEDFYPPLGKYFEFTVYAPQENVFGVIISDITEKVNSKKILEESELRYKTLIEFSPDGIFWIQKKRIVFANKKAFDLLGVNDLDQINQYPLEFFLPEKIVKVLTLGSNDEIILNQKRAYIKTFAGKDIPVEITLVSMSAQEEIYQMLIRDITEKEEMTTALAESERRFLLAMEAVNDGVFEWDLLNDRIYFSERNFTMLGFQPGEFEANHLVWDQMIHPDDRAKNYMKLRRHLKGELDHYEIEYRIKNKKGNYQWILERGKVIERDDNGYPLKIVGTHSDIDLRKHMEENLRLALEKAEESNRLKSAFLTNMSHEIRTPMNGILGFSALLERDDLSAEKRKMYIEVIKSSSRQLLNIVNDILDISKIASGQLKLIEEPFNLHLLMQSLYNTYSEELIYKGLNDKIELILSVRSDTTPMILADKSRLQQILEHLLNNAVKFTSEGEIEFGYHEKAEELEFYVKDTGIGIEPEKHQLIFEAFRQIDMSDSRRYGGLGVGLSICHGLITLMGGKIWLESEPGKGTTFFFTIPLQKPMQNSDFARHTVDVPKFSVIPQVLVVEDVMENYLLLDEILKSIGANVFHASEGNTAIQLLKEKPEINLILLDLRLPDMSGYDVFEIIKQNYPHIPVIVQTAYALIEDKAKILQMGFDGYLVKPIDKTKLIQMIYNILERKKQI
ncbi:MAG: PAS domain S-box protein [Bacteroidales bacterium]|nr:PAS domain S-box protein [Bacteroidales bacterium]